MLSLLDFGSDYTEILKNQWRFTVCSLYWILSRKAVLIFDVVNGLRVLNIIEKVHWNWEWGIWEWISEREWERERENIRETEEGE